MHCALSGAPLSSHHIPPSFVTCPVSTSPEKLYQVAPHITLTLSSSSSCSFGEYWCFILQSFRQNESCFNAHFLLFFSLAVQSHSIHPLSIFLPLPSRTQCLICSGLGSQWVGSCRWQTSWSGHWLGIDKQKVELEISPRLVLYQWRGSHLSSCDGGSAQADCLDLKWAWWSRWVSTKICQTRFIDLFCQLSPRLSALARRLFLCWKLLSPLWDRPPPQNCLSGDWPRREGKPWENKLPDSVAATSPRGLCRPTD